MQGEEQLAIERSAYEAKKFTFYRVKKAPKDSGIDPSRTEENGVVKCVFTQSRSLRGYSSDYLRVVSTSDDKRRPKCYCG